MEFVALAHYNFAAASQAFSFTGMAAGDLATVVVQNSFTVSTTPAGWAAIAVPNWSGLGYTTMLFWKQLTSADITAGSVTVTGTDPNAAGDIYTVRGPNSVALKSATDSGGVDATLVLPAFTKAGGSTGVAIFIFDRDVSSPYVQPGVDGLVARDPPWNSGYFTASIHDFLASRDYLETSLTFTGFANSFQQRGLVLEYT